MALACQSQSALSDVDLGGSWLVVDPINVAVNGTDVGEVQVHLAHADGRAWRDTAVSVDAGGCLVVPDLTTTDATGNANFTVQCAAEALVPVAARVHIGGQAAAVPAAAAVSFYRPSDGARGVGPGAPLALQLVARRPDGGVDAAYAGRASFRSSDAAALLPQPRALSAADHGVASIADGMALTTLGTQTLEAVDDTGRVLAAVSLLVTRGASMVGFVQSALEVTAGDTTTLDLAARGEDGRPDPTFVNQALLRSSDPAASLPEAVTFAAADAGLHAVEGVVFRTAGAQTVTAIDQSSGRATTLAVRVGPAAAARIHLTAPATTVAGAPLDLTVQVQDAFGNAISALGGGVALGTDDSQAIVAPATAWPTPLPPSGLRLPAAVRPRRAGLLTIIARTGGATTGLAGQARVQVAPGPAASLAINAPASATAGDLLTFSVAAMDAFGNIASAFVGDVHVTASAPRAVVPGLLSFGVENVGRILSARATRLVDTGQTAITATAVGHADLSGAASVQVAPAAASRVVATTAASATAGTPTDLAVAVEDAFGNLCPDFVGTLALAASDPSAVLFGGGSVALGAADGGRRTLPGAVTWHTAGSQQITLTGGTLAGAVSPCAVAPGPLVGFALDGLPAQSVQTQPLSPTLRAVDTFGNTVSTYAGTLHFSADVAATLPADVTLGAADAGQRTLPGQLSVDSIGTGHITVADLARGLSYTVALTGTHGCWRFGDVPLAGPPWSCCHRPDLRLDALDRPSVTWLFQADDTCLAAARWTGSAWQTLGPPPISQGPPGPPPQNGRRQRLVVDSQGRTGIAFGGQNDKNIFFARTSDGTWTDLANSLTTPVVTNALINITSLPLLGSFLDVAVDGADAPWIAYSQPGAGGLPDISVWAYQSSAWGAVGTSPSFGVGGTNLRPQLAFDGSHTPWVAWDGTAPGNAEVLVSFGPTVASGGAWTAPSGAASVYDNVSQTPGTSNYASLAVGPDGRPVVAWTDDSSGTPQIYLRRFVGGTWQELAGSGSGQGISGAPAGSDGARYPSVAVGPDGEPSVAWLDTTHGAIYLRRFDGSAWQEQFGSASGGGVGGADLRFTTLAIDSQNRAVLLLSRTMGDNALDVCSWR